VHIEKENATQENIYVTTADFRVKNIKSDKYLDDDVVKKIFPPNSITGDHIIFARLRPKISPEIPGEKLHIKAKMSIHTAGEDGAYNVTSICSYRNTPDRIKQDSVWQEYSTTLKESDPDELEIIKQDWYNLKAKRINIPNSFDFKIQSIGIFSNIDIVKKGCEIMIKRIENLKNNVEDPNTLDDMILTQAASTIPNCFDIILINEDYTLGKVIEYIIHEKFYEETSMLTYVGFKKPHPHNKDSLLRIAFKNNVSESDKYTKIRTIISSACDIGIDIFTTINSEFINE
jgi:DNA-directed RNA polymerase subunit L